VNAGELHSLARALRQIATEATSNRGEGTVSAGDLAIAEDIAHNNGTSIAQIVQRTGLAQSQVSKTVAAMRDAGVLDVVPDPVDGRRVSISVSPKTRRMFRSRAARPVEGAIRGIRPDASDAEIAEIVELLDRLAARLRP
jgi:DNA-binding MarR family transcriptional regulator